MEFHNAKQAALITSSKNLPVPKQKKMVVYTPFFILLHMKAGAHGKEAPCSSCPVQTIEVEPKDAFHRPISWETASPCSAACSAASSSSTQASHWLRRTDCASHLSPRLGGTDPTDPEPILACRFLAFALSRVRACKKSLLGEVDASSAADFRIPWLGKASSGTEALATKLRCIRLLATQPLGAQSLAKSTVQMNNCAGGGDDGYWQ